MSRYTEDQKLEIFLAYERSNSVKTTQLELRRKFQIEPSGPTIRRIHQNLRTQHKLTIKPPGRPRSARSEENLNHIKQIAQSRTDDNIPTSTRRLALEMENEGIDISKSSIQRLLKSDSSMKPYHERPIHELKEIDKPRRLEMCRILLNKIQENPQFLENIIWTDEAKFELRGAVNSHNTMYWSDHNPQIVRERNRIDQRGICVWAGIWAGGRIGPFEIEGHLNATMYQNLLREQIIPSIGDVSRFWFMQDGAPAHKARGSQALLREIFDDRVISIGSTPEGAARSPDLTPCDFYLWGEMKNKVYRHASEDLDQLRSRIVQEFNSLDQNHIKNACMSVKKRFEDCIMRNGRSVQHAGQR